MNYMMETPVPVTERDFEKLSMLAEDVMQTLYMRYSDFDSDGNDILMKYYKGRQVVSDETWEQEICPLSREEKNQLMDSPEDMLLANLFRRGDDISDVRYYTLSDIRPWIEPLIPKALGIFRKGTGEVTGDTNYVAAKTVSDEILIAAFAREVRNMMMIFAAQKFKRDDSHYLLAFASKSCHDNEEWLGIYHDDEILKAAYEKAENLLEEKRKMDASYRSMSVEIWEFEPLYDYEIKEELEKREGVGKPSFLEQKVMPVKKEELRCFREKRRN